MRMPISELQKQMRHMAYYGLARTTQDTQLTR